MKEAYEALEIEVIEFETSDIISSSSCQVETEPLSFDDEQLS